MLRQNRWPVGDTASITFGTENQVWNSQGIESWAPMSPSRYSPAHVHPIVFASTRACTCSSSSYLHSHVSLNSSNRAGINIQGNQKHITGLGTEGLSPNETMKAGFESKVYPYSLFINRTCATVCTVCGICTKSSWIHKWGRICDAAPRRLRVYNLIHYKYVGLQSCNSWRDEGQ